MSAQRAEVMPANSNPPARRRRKKPSVLFVDDEQRVLNSMRALFRREYDVHMTTVGSEAIKILKDNTIDVIVCDQRMPEMTGVEVLGAGKEVSPATVRILLTGYADLDAIEGSINVGEVFRFLSKPCPPNHLRETLKLAVDIAKTTRAEQEKVSAAQPAPPSAPPAVATPAPKASPMPVSDEAKVLVVEDDEPLVDAAELEVEFSPADTIAIDNTASVNEPIVDTGEVLALEDSMPSIAELEAQGESIVMSEEPDLAASGDSEIVLGGDTDLSGQPTQTQVLNHAISSVGVVVFSSSDTFTESAQSMLSEEHNVLGAKTLVQVTEILAKGDAGVLVTDFISEGRVLRKMIATLKRYLPELITIVISDDRDASEMIALINHGQVFRYMSKPAQRDRFTQNVNAAVLKHIQLRDNPELLSRYQVELDDSGPAVPQMFMQFLGKIKSVRRMLGGGS